MLENSNLEGLIDAIYPALQLVLNCSDDKPLAERAILAARNIDVDIINSTLLHHRTSEDHIQVYKSADSVTEEDQTLYSSEYLNTLQPSGVQPHELRLKLGAPVMLLRNINPAAGLCNGTHLKITRLLNYVIVGVFLIIQYPN